MDEDLHDLVDKVITQIKRDLACQDVTAMVDLLMSAPRSALESYLPEDEDTEPYLCPTCNGSGEGQYEGTRCWACKGSGEVSYADDEER